MNICSHCGEVVTANRYGHTGTLCRECEYYANTPEDTLGDALDLDGELASHELRAAVERTGHRWDQWLFSAWVCAVALAVGLLAGIWLAWVEVARQMPQ